MSANIFSLGELTDVFSSYYTSEETKESCRNKIRRAKLIAIDEFDLAQKSDHVLGICFEIIDMRYRTDMPILITTNTMPKEIVTERSLIKRKIYDRIRTCEVAVIEGQSRRRWVVENALYAFPAMRRLVIMRNVYDALPCHLMIVRNA